MGIKAKRVELRPGWVSFKLPFDPNSKILTKEQLIERIKRRLVEKMGK